ncbi:MAG: hypothetical protein ABGX11_03380 [Candidatus Poseidoniia archaeon]|jgi:hypothetical protein
MADLASMVLGSVQDTIVEAFGATTGWLVGHLIVLGILALAVVAVQNRQHMVDHSGFGSGTFQDLAVVIALTAVQYVIFTGTFNFSESVSLGLAIISTLILRWHILIVE